MSNPWILTQDAYENCACRSQRSEQIRVDLDDDYLSVDVEVGSGYMREHTTAHLPVETLIQLLQHAGYVVERRQAPEEANDG